MEMMTWIWSRRRLKCQVTQGEILQVMTGVSTTVMEQMTMMTSSFSVLRGLNVAITGDITSFGLLTSCQPQQSEHDVVSTEWFVFTCFVFHCLLFFFFFYWMTLKTDNNPCTMTLIRAATGR